MITLGLPTYNNSNIIWLQLEAICNQVNTVPFELIIIEEKSDNYFSEQGIEVYRQRLEAAGMVSFKYISLDGWIPLSKKWLIIRDNMSKDSAGLLLCASDNYSPPYRIEETYKAFKEGHDWVQWNKGRFYNILNHTAATYTAAPNRPALFMGIRADKLKQFTHRTLPSSAIDTWLYKGVKAKNVKRFDYCKEGIHTDGYNTISFARRNMYNDGVYFTPTDSDDTFNEFPEYVQNKLKALC
jgi:hypothetical protein